MSFILDALRKSESERQQESRPNIARIPEAVPQRKLPHWALATIAALGLGIIVLSLAWWRSAQGPVEADSSTLRAADPTTTAPLPIPRRETARLTEPSVRRPAPVAASESSLRRAASTAASGRVEARSSTPGSDAALPAPAEGSAATPAAQPRGSSLQRYSAADGNLPALRLELHAYAEDPSSRFVFINGSRYSEGQTLAEGPRLVAITPDGAVVLAGGRQWLLGQQ